MLNKKKLTGGGPNEETQLDFNTPKEGSRFFIPFI